MNKRFPPRAKKAAPIVQAGRENLQKSSDILHQHRLSLASQLRNFDNRWADLFSSTPVLNKLTKGRQKPEEFHTNAQNLLDDVQVALRDAHSRKQRKGREQDSIIPDPLPIPYSTRQGPRSISIFPIAEEEFEEEPDKKSMMQRVRSKLKRKKAIKKKGSRPGLSRFNPFKKRVTPGSDTITEVEPRKVKHKSSRRSVPSSSGSGSRSRSRHRSPRHKSSRRLREQQPEPPVIPTEFKPYLPEPPMLPPMKLEMSSIGYYHPSSPSIASPPRPQRDYRYHLDPSVGPSSPQPYYLSVQNEQNSPRHRPRESIIDIGLTKIRSVAMILATAALVLTAIIDIMIATTTPGATLNLMTALLTHIATTTTTPGMTLNLTTALPTHIAIITREIAAITSLINPLLLTHIDMIIIDSGSQYR
ncbi:hypothetical protein Moror_14965 [Moniliophthora roreri MCA 2997]|uniref:Uncharacterized protein n=1 Tax=Moniliophthora roreri (strain MCA 2997) TaxID=1381753 RepID=V2WX96_MONRO|nr:hypothetical protein Moror_14965 [Moniliophthora roreri MCA 2997]